MSEVNRLLLFALLSFSLVCWLAGEGEEEGMNDDNLRWRFFKTSDALMGAYAPGGARFMSPQVLVLEEEGAEPYSKVFWDLESGKRIDSGFLGAKGFRILDYSQAANVGLIRDTQGRTHLVDTANPCESPQLFPSLDGAYELGFLKDGQLLYGIRGRPGHGSQVVDVFRKDEEWVPVYSLQTGASSQVAFSEDGANFVVFSGGTLASAKRYDVASGELLEEVGLGPHVLNGISVSTLSVSPSGRYAFLEPRDGDSYLLVDFEESAVERRVAPEEEKEEGEEEENEPEDSDYVFFKGFSPSGDKYTIVHNRAFWILDTESGGSLARFEASTAALVLSGIGFSAAGDRVVVARGIDEIAIVDLSDLSELEYDVGVRDIATLRFLPSEEKVLVGNYGGEYSIYDLNGNDAIQVLTKERSHWAAYLPDAKRILALTDSSLFREFSAETLDELEKGVSAVPFIASVVGFSPPSRRVLIDFLGMEVRQIGSFDPLLRIADSSIVAATLSYNGARVAYVPYVSLDENSILRIVNVDTGGIEKEISFSERRFIERIAFSHDGTRLYMVERDESLRYTLRVYQVEDGGLLSSSPQFERFVDMTVSELFGPYIATEYNILKFDEYTGELSLSVRVGRFPELVDKIRVDSNGNRIAVSTTFNRLTVFDVEKARILFSSSMGAAPSFVATGLSPDFDFINSEGDVMVRWESGLLEILELQEGRMVSLSFAGDKEGIHYTFDTEDESRYVLDRTLSMDEWSEKLLFWGNAADRAGCSNFIKFDELETVFLRVWEFR